MLQCSPEVPQPRGLASGWGQEDREQNLSSWYQRDTALSSAVFQSHESLTGKNKWRNQQEGQDTSLKKSKAMSICQGYPRAVMFGWRVNSREGSWPKTLWMFIWNDEHFWFWSSSRAKQRVLCPFGPSKQRRGPPKLLALTHQEGCWPMASCWLDHASNDTMGSSSWCYRQ